MPLTLAQQQTLKADILASPDTSFLYTEGDYPGLANLYNVLAVPNYIVWRTLITRAEYQANAAFNWTVVDGLSVARGRIWEWLFENPERAVNPSAGNVRAGIVECWKGNANLEAIGTALLQQSKRLSTRYERVFAAGTGTDAVPGILAVSGPVIPQEFIPLRDL